MKRPLLLLLSTVLSVLLCGCSATTPLKERLVVEGIAIDRTEDRFLVTLQVYSPSSDTTTQKENQLFQATGDTVFQALRLIDENIGKQSFFSDTKVIAFSYDALQQGLWSNLDYFMRSSEIGSNVCLAATGGKAADLFQIEEEGVNMPSKVLANALHYGKSQSLSASGELMSVASDLLIQNADVSLPVVEVQETQDKKYPVLNGILCFQGEKPRYQMSPQDQWVYNWLHEYQDDRSFVLPFQGRAYSLYFQKTDHRLTVEIREGVPCFRVDLTVECDIMEINREVILDVDGLKPLQAALEEHMERLTLSTLERVVVQEQCDVFRLGRTLEKQQPEYYKTLEDWRTQMTKCRFACNVKATVARAGQGNVEE